MLANAKQISNLLSHLMMQFYRKINRLSIIKAINQLL